MAKFKYREKFLSKFKAYRKYIYKVMSLKKNIFLCKSTEQKKKYILRLSLLKKCFKAAEYPEYIKQHPDARLAVYTVLFGNYDRIKPVGIKGEKCDYYIVTDQTVDEKSGWKKKDFIFPDSLQNADNATKNRYLKMHPEVLFPEYEFSLYLDATIQPVCDMFPLLGRMSEHFIAMYRHETRNCIYKEAETVVRIGKADKAEVDELTSRYRAEGFPENFGLTAGGIILRRHNSKECRKTMDLWWETFTHGPKRDQLSLMWCMWKNGYTLNDFALLGADYDLDPRFASQSHK